jgi:hypothetical protein
MVAAVGFLILQVWAAPTVSPSNDTYHYAQTALRIRGESKQTAQDIALRAYCDETAAWLARGQRVDPGAVAATYRRDEAVTRCVRDAPHGLPPTSARYGAIFESRIAFPMLAAPLVAVFGVNQALKATSVFLTALGGLIAYLILRILGLRRPQALLGQGLYYAGPIGWWGSYGLTDGPTVTTSMATLLGAILLLRHRYRLGAILFIGSIVVGCFIRYSNFMFITLAVMAATGVGLVTDPRQRRPLLLVIALSAVGLVGLAAAAHALHWSGASDTLQDTFTGHFTRPDVADPWHRLARLNVQYWSQWAQEQVRSPWLVAAVAIGSVTLVRRYRTFGLTAVAVALTGFLNQAAHPVVSQSDRLLIEVSVAAVLGLPLLAAREATPRRCGGGVGCCHTRSRCAQSATASTDTAKSPSRDHPLESRTPRCLNLKPRLFEG